MMLAIAMTTMDTQAASLAQPERRAAQRFPLSQPVAVKSAEGSFAQETGLCHDVSAKGIYFFMKTRPPQGAPIEFTVVLPAEVTLSDPLRVNCKGRVVRVVEETPVGSFGVAATIDGYNSFIRLSRTDAFRIA